MLVFPGPKSLPVEGVRLLTAYGSLMLCSSTPIIPLRFSCSLGSKVYTWNFQLATVSVPLLGADFLKHFHLLVDIKGRKVVHANCPEDVIILASPGPQPAITSQYPISPLLSGFRDFWKSFQLFYLPTDLLPQNLVTSPSSSPN